MPVLTGRETTPDFCAVRLLLESIDRSFNVPAVRLAVWSAYAGLSTGADFEADLGAVRIQRSGLLTRLTAEEIDNLVCEVFDRNHPEVERHF